ncbi:MAG: Uma2 family endonuclease [Acidobacteria bacterium]|nr:Uma2 family endonuclease [Acidobacteriota bacterium]
MTTRNPSLLVREPLRIPPDADTLEGFRRWSSSEAFPEKGRIDFLDGELEVELSPEDIYTHGGAKTALAAVLYDLVVRTGRGAVYVDCTRVVSVTAQLSVEPDVLAVLWESLETGRVREVPAASRKEGRFIEFEGAPDLVVEVLSDSSERKDRLRLPPLYASAGVPELWRVDVRGPEVDLGIHHLGPSGYVQAPVDAEGWCVSRFLGSSCRLLRRAVHGSRFVYELEVAP